MEARALTAKEIADRLSSAASHLIPMIVDSNQSTMGLVGLDTVAYSEEGDRTQVEVVKSFLTYASESWKSVVASDRWSALTFCLLATVSSLGSPVVRVHASRWTCRLTCVESSMLLRVTRLGWRFMQVPSQL